MQHFGEKLAVPIVVALVATGNMVACWPYSVDTMVQAVVLDRIDFAIEHIVAIELERIVAIEHIVAIDNVPKVVRYMVLLTDESRFDFGCNFDTTIHKVNRMRLKLNNIVGVDVVSVHICPSDDIVIFWENLLNRTIHRRFVTSNVCDELVFVQSCSSCRSCCHHFDNRCWSSDVLIFLFDCNDLGIVVPVHIVCTLVHMLRPPF